MPYLACHLTKAELKVSQWRQQAHSMKTVYGLAIGCEFKSASTTDSMSASLFWEWPEKQTLSHSVCRSRSHEHKVCILMCTAFHVVIKHSPILLCNHPKLPKWTVWWYLVKPAKCLPQTFWMVGQDTASRGNRAGPMDSKHKLWNWGRAHSWALPFPLSLTRRLTAVSREILDSNLGLRHHKQVCLHGKKIKHLPLC